MPLLHAGGNNLAAFSVEMVHWTVPVTGIVLAYIDAS